MGRGRGVRECARGTVITASNKTKPNANTLQQKANTRRPAFVGIFFEVTEIRIQK